MGTNQGDILFFILPGLPWTNCMDNQCGHWFDRYFHLVILRQAPPRASDRRPSKDPAVPGHMRRETVC